MSIFERLENLIADHESAGGISVLHLQDLPPSLRRLMRIMLREAEMTYQDLGEAIKALPEENRLSQDDLDEALRVLTEQSWLIQMGEGERVTYKVNLRARPGSKLGAGIFNAINSRIEEESGKSAGDE